ncbi:MAG: glutaredoxin family protein [Gaiellaceae bacterium]
MSRVVVYTAPGCSLCEPALAAVREACGDDFEVVDISDDPALEAEYRPSLPVVEVDGERAFAYFVDAEALRALLA